MIKTAIKAFPHCGKPMRLLHARGFPHCGKAFFLHFYETSLLLLDVNIAK